MGSNSFSNSFGGVGGSSDDVQYKRCISMRSPSFFFPLSPVFFPCDSWTYIEKTPVSVAVPAIPVGKAIDKATQITECIAFSLSLGPSIPAIQLFADWHVVTDSIRPDQYDQLKCRLSHQRHSTDFCTTTAAITTVCVSNAQGTNSGRCGSAEWNRRLVVQYFHTVAVIGTSGRIRSPSLTSNIFKMKKGSMDQSDKIG